MKKLCACEQDSETFRKIVVFNAIGGFHLTPEAIVELRRRGCAAAHDSPLFGEMWDFGRVCDFEDGEGGKHIPRDDPHLVALVEEWGERAGETLRIVQVPDNVAWEVVDACDGREYVIEKTRVWWAEPEPKESE